MSWCFAIVNNKLAEIYFDKTKKEPKIWNRCYVKRSEYKTKKEQKWIDSDIKKFRFVYRKGKYRRILEKIDR